MRGDEKQKNPRKLCARESKIAKKIQIENLKKDRNVTSSLEMQ